MSLTRAPAATATATMLRAGEGAGTDHLWAMAAELERDFAGYKRRLAERRAQHAGAEAAGRGAGGGSEEEEERAGDAAGGRGRRYEEYVRRRDERLRQEWRARMERKEAEVQALWARLDRTGSRGGGRRGGDDDHDDGELAAATSHAREDQVKPPQKPGNLVVKVKPSTPVTPRGNPGHPPAAKLARPRTSVPSSLAAGSPSPRLSTPDSRRRPSHLHRGQPQAQQHPPATPRKENSRLPPAPASAALAAAASPATPRPRTTMLSRSRSMFKDRSCSSVGVGVGESPRPPQFQPPRSSYDGGASCASSNLKEPRAEDDAIAVPRSTSCSREKQVVVADPRKASAAVAPEPFLVRRSGNDIEPTSSAPPLVASKERGGGLPYITPAAGCGNADRKRNQQEYVDQSSDKFGSEEMITGDSDTEPSYVYIKNKDSDEQIPRPPRAPAGVGTTCPAPEPRPRSDTDNKDSDDNVEDTMESTGSNEEVAGETPAADAEEEELRRESSSESLYSNVQSSFSPRSELDTSATGSPLPNATEQSPSPESNTSPWTTGGKKKSMEVEVAEKRPPTPTTPRSSVQSPMDAVNGLKRLLTFGKRNGGKANETAAAAAGERAPRSVAPAPPAAGGGDGSVSVECPAGGSAKPRVISSESDDLDGSYVISPPHVGSLQSIGPPYTASSELKEPVLHAKSPRVHRSFFSFSSFKSRAN